MGVNCFHCGASLELEVGQKVFRSEECPSCYGDIRICRMCGLYDTAYYNECREDQAQRVIDKERANYCEYFTLAGGEGPMAQEHLQRAKALFKD